MVSCGLPFDLEINFLDGTYTVKEISERLVVRYASYPETYLHQVFPTGATVPSNKRSYERHDTCSGEERRRMTDNETLYLSNLQKWCQRQIDTE